MTAAFQMAPSEWWKTVALGLVLLLVAAHLGAWTWRTRPAPARANPKQAPWDGTTASPANALAEDASTSGASGAAAGGLAKYRGRRRRPGRP